MGINAVKARRDRRRRRRRRAEGQRTSRRTDARRASSRTHSGGILGGISSGQDIVVHLRSSRRRASGAGRTIDVAGNAAEVVTTGRHDPCVGLRATPIAEAMLAIVLMDHYLRHRAQNADVQSASRRRPSRATALSVSLRSAERWPMSRSASQSCGAGRHRPRWRNHDPRARGAQVSGRELYPAGEQPLAGQDACEFQGKRLPGRSTSRPSTSRGAEIGLFSAGGEVSAEYAPSAAAAGCVVIDNTSQFRYEDDIPLVVPEVNPHAIAQYRKRGIIANPNCSTIQMVVALKPIHDAVGIKRINVATYQSVSGAGTAGRRRAGRARRPSCSTAGRSRAEGARQADRLQLRAADRQVPGQRLHQGRDEDVLGDPEDPRTTSPSG